ncbi:MAG: hypothetical protein LBM78_04365 [Clostridiales bacterium]|jgi:heme/copper-type cytochrome/quinol oxidase subunit 2|nr:hypothetical protein [Clostridiales bacterium]
MSSKKRPASASAATKRSIEERMAEQRAQEKRKKRNKLIAVLSAVGAVALAVVIIVVVAVHDVRAKDVDGVQTVTTTMTARGSNDITVKAGKQVKWTIKGGAGDLGCMNEVNCSKLSFGGRAVFSGRSTVVTFTPAKKGTYTVVCEHGNTVNTITVV